MNLKAQQSALFKVQKWHLRRKLYYQKALRQIGRLQIAKERSGVISLSVIEARRAAKRNAAKHTKFIDAITPFLLP